MEKKQQKIENMITMIGCDRNEFLNLIKGWDNISISSGSYYSNFNVYSGARLLAVYDYHGRKI